MDGVTAQVEAAIICFYREPARAAEANAYLVAFQQSDSAWEIAEQLLISSHADVSHFAACSLHQQAKRSASARSTDVLQVQCSRLLGTVGSMPSALVRSQLCLAVSVLAASLFAADTGGPAALCASAVFMALPPGTKIELLAALPQACPLHHEQLRVLLSHVLSLLQAALRPPPSTPSTLNTLHSSHPLPSTLARVLAPLQPLRHTNAASPLDSTSFDSTHYDFCVLGTSAARRASRGGHGPVPAGVAAPRPRPTRPLQRPGVCS